MTELRNPIARRFDFRAYLEDRGIEYWEGGENVTRGWVNINCPFSDCDDDKNHMGVNLESKFFSCWICGRKGGVDFLVQVIEGGISEAHANTIMDGFPEMFLPEEEKPEIQRPMDLVLPKEATKEFPEPHRQYLKERGFDPDYLIEKYGLLACYTTGPYKYRILCPTFFKGKVVNFVGMAIFKPPHVPPYKNSENDKSVLPVKETMYNLDNVESTAVIVEGITDVWKIGDGACATFGLRYTPEQIRMIKRKKVERAFVMFDGEERAIKVAKQLASNISAFVPYVEVVELPDEVDPADLTKEEIQNFKKEIGL